ncbi:MULTISPECIES: hypothetical protein [Methanosarcina]|uniref:Uncharacterized protein n=2 Tax=Methanosarcina mazei TaxID=2209 RepID=A0A0F8KN78_METMZ|nr:MULTISPECIES: hypothetical protein [Methanosarcina]AKB72103.1 hypothetical protein MSMAC_2213 [Methanosarcina mazei C16]KKG18867.1 hypothetical protein DU34_01980 [Methanosarcina mazei]KKG35189.1 hypothetical protein DU49_17600 [Methanosarcina mazei]KKG42542.1 hypothetical protein DU39_18685 [Methanosarcina mazei]KKG43956.1 hypothetical protein DU35_03245 [Methanosarcina mazei]
MPEINIINISLFSSKFLGITTSNQKHAERFPAKVLAVTKIMEVYMQIWSRSRKQLIWLKGASINFVRPVDLVEFSFTLFSLYFHFISNRESIIFQKMYFAGRTIKLS